MKFSEANGLDDFHHLFIRKAGVFTRFAATLAPLSGNEAPRNPFLCYFSWCPDHGLSD